MNVQIVLSKCPTQPRITHDFSLVPINYSDTCKFQGKLLKSQETNSFTSDQRKPIFQRKLFITIQNWV